jgi:hypothetical protein
MLLWENLTSELDRYLPEDDRITPGTGMTSPDVPPEELPILAPGVRLYDFTLAWIKQTWVGYNTMPPRGKQLWFRVLRLSHRRSAPADSLKRWANWLVENIAAFSRTPGDAPHLPSDTSPKQKEPPPDGPEGGRWLWWKNKRCDIPKGNVYKLLEFMWDRDSASYDNLIGPVFADPVEPQTIRSYANKLKNALPSGFPWRLSTNAVNRQLTKVWATQGQ